MKHNPRILVLLSLLLMLPVHAKAAAQDKPFDGLIEPDKLIAVSSPISGVLDEVDVDKGDHVKAGQVIARLKSGVEKADFDLAKAKYEYSERQLERNRELIEKKLISQKDHDDIVTKALIAKMEMKKAEEQLKLHIIRSPISGVVVDRSYSPGEFVQEHAILKIARLNPLKVEVFLPVFMFGQIHKGTSAEIHVDGYQQTFTGHVSLVDPIIDAASDTFAVEIKLPNKNELLPAGLKCKVGFPGKEKPKPSDSAPSVVHG